MVTRPEYLSKLSVWREKQVIKVITGIRRSGKSTLFELYSNWLKSTGVTDEQIDMVSQLSISKNKKKNRIRA